MSARVAPHTWKPVLGLSALLVLFVGPMDLSVSLGIPRQFDHPEFRAALAQVVEACKKHGKAAGILAGAPAQLERFVQRGRLLAETRVLVGEKERLFDVIAQASSDASVVFLGLRAPEPDEGAEAYASYYEGLMARTSGLEPMVVYTLAAENVDFQRIWDG